FHAMGDVQLGPGKGARFETHARDEGRFRVTGNPADLYAFRTPSLRNVAQTGPYGHAGGHRSLASYITAHADPLAALEGYDRDEAVLPTFGAADWRILDDPIELAAIEAAVGFVPVPLTEEDLASLVAFLESLSDPVALEGRLGVPEAVPSGLTVVNP
ncbi:MAG: cytochrome-c peroxidase, partial [Flavimaricola sp.]|nr:cytochrome-c peroxidase [Flavimaricola sp.]